MQYIITITGIGDEEVAKSLAAQIDSGGKAFHAFIDITVNVANGPAQEPVWTNMQTVSCEACGGHGKVGSSDDPDECLACLGSGQVAAR